MDSALDSLRLPEPFASSKGHLAVWRAWMRKLLQVIALGALFGCMDIADISSAIDNVRSVARIGVIGHTEIEWPNSTARFQKALSFYRSCNVDAIVVIGELTKDGYMNQYRVLSQAWDTVFKNPVTGIDQNPPRRIFVLGEREKATYKAEFGTEFNGDVSVDGGLFNVNGFAFRVASSKPVDHDSIITFHADEKMALTDELCWYPRTRPCINVGSLSGVDVKAGFDQVSNAVKSAQGLLVTVYSREISVARIDFNDNEPVAEDWRISRDGCALSAAEQRAPEFWTDTELRVFHMNEPGKPSAFKVVWPPVLAKHTGVRAHSYEVVALMEVGEGAREVTVKRRYVLTPNFYRAEKHDSGPVSCFFDKRELPETSRVRFKVTPISCYGERGRSLESCWI